MRTWDRPRLVTITGYDTQNKVLAKEVVLPFQYHDALDRVKAVAGIARIGVKQNYKTW